MGLKVIKGHAVCQLHKYRDTYKHTDAYTHMHLGGCGLGPGELGQEKGEDATDSFPSFGGRSRGGRRGLITATWCRGTCSVVLGRFTSSLLPLESYYCMGVREGFSVNPITPPAS